MSVWPNRLGYLSVGLTILVVVVFTYSNWESFRYLQRLKNTDIPLIQDSGIIVRHDEILYSSLQLATTTKDIKWVDKYENHKFVLTDSIDQFVEQVQDLDPSQVDALKRTKPFKIEEEVIAKIQKAEFHQARELLLSVEYQDAVDEFREVIYLQSAHVLESQEATLESRWQEAFIYTVSAVISLIMIVLSWTMVLATMKQNSKKIEVQKEKIQVQEQKAFAASKLASLGEMAGGVAHEINNPLAIIHGYSDMLAIRAQEEELSMEEVSSLALHIKQTSERIAKIVKGLRALARDGSNDPFEVVPIRAVVDDTVNLVGEKFNTNGVGLFVDFESMEGVNFSCRQVQFSQIMVNLINNAYDAVQSYDEKWVKVWVEDFGDLFTLNVEDSGDGISPEIEQKIFQPLFTTKDVGHGTGLGLSISATIVKDHNGTIHVDHKAKNTRFVMHLPKAINDEDINEEVA